MSLTLAVGFDSAWTAHNQGALVGVLLQPRRPPVELGLPMAANFEAAEALIRYWRQEHAPVRTIIAIDQPTIVKNKQGQRPVENIVCSLVSKCRGGMQPANLGRRDMFGRSAPISRFLTRTGASVRLSDSSASVLAVEVYPTLTLIAADGRYTRPLPKYNPANRAKFKLADWRWVCRFAGDELAREGLARVPAWLASVRDKSAPNKADQDKVDSCLCLATALRLARKTPCMQIGSESTGYIAVAYDRKVAGILKERCSSLSARNAAAFSRHGDMVRRIP